MPKTLKIVPHLEPEELENRYRKAHDPVERSHYQSSGLLARANHHRVMEVTGYSRGWIQQLARRYNASGPEARRPQAPQSGGHRQGAPRRRGRRELARALRERPSDGGMWNSRKVAEWIEHKTGKKASKQRGWEYLRKLGHSPKVPRPRHKDADGRQQEAFKKGSR